MAYNPEDLSVGDIVCVEFIVMVVRSRRKDEEGMRMINVLRGIKVLQKYVPEKVNEQYIQLKDILIDIYRTFHRMMKVWH